MFICRHQSSRNNYWYAEPVVLWSYCWKHRLHTHTQRIFYFCVQRLLEGESCFLNDSAPVQTNVCVSVSTFCIHIHTYPVGTHILCVGGSIPPQARLLAWLIEPHASVLVSMLKPCSNVQRQTEQEVLLSSALQVNGVHPQMSESSTECSIEQRVLSVVTWATARRNICWN